MPVLSTITQEKDDCGFLRKETYKTERGLELSIVAGAGGLYEIIPNGGGKPPRVCDERYTSHLRARKALCEYIDSTDRLGYAEHPEKDPAKMRKPRVEPKQDI